MCLLSTLQAMALKMLVYKQERKQKETLIRSHIHNVSWAEYKKLLLVTTFAILALGNLESMFVSDASRGYMLYLCFQIILKSIKSVSNKKKKLRGYSNISQCIEFYKN